MITRNRIASLLAFIIGLMAVVAGGKVLLGTQPGYYVINWLPVYNFAVGLVSAFFTAVVIWKNHRLAWPAAVATFGLHAVVMLILLSAYRAVVAPDSLMAMSARLVVWLIILVLLKTQKQKGG